MITPIFDISQDNLYLFIKIKAPNANITETEVHIEQNDFRFYSKPYFLRLCLPSEIVENGEELADYDSNSGTFMIKVSKLNAGQHFEGLDLLTKLLVTNNKQTNYKPLIEVIDGKQTTSDSNQWMESIDEDFEWNFDQTLRHETDDLSLFGEKYGFANEKSGVIARIVEEFNDLIDIKDPEHKTLAKRTTERLESESLDFNDDHYLYDKYEQKEMISNLISFKSIWDECEPIYRFNDEEKFRMKNLVNKEYIFDKNRKKSLLLGMIDILFAYVYDMRINEYEHSVESAWNICKLSSTLSWFESCVSLNQVLISCMRRSLCYPLYRNWELSIKVLNDTTKVIKLGQNHILKCFLDIHKLFNETGDGRYILNDLYITDYCVWLQHISPHTFISLAKALTDVQIDKNDVNLELNLLERAASLAIEENQLRANSQQTIENCINNIEESKSSETDSDDSESIIDETSSESSSDTSDDSIYYSDRGNSVCDSDDSNHINDSDDDSSSDESEEVSSNVALIYKDTEVGRSR